MAVCPRDFWSACPAKLLGRRGLTCPHHGQGLSTGGPWAGWWGGPQKHKLWGGCPCLSISLLALTSWRASPTPRWSLQKRRAEEQCLPALQRRLCYSPRFPTPVAVASAAAVLSGDSGRSQLTPFYSQRRKQLTPGTVPASLRGRHQRVYFLFFLSFF